MLSLILMLKFLLLHCPLTVVGLGDENVEYGTQYFSWQNGNFNST
jgi:hypothetical protein